MKQKILPFILIACLSLSAAPFAACSESEEIAETQPPGFEEVIENESTNESEAGSETPSEENPSEGEETPEEPVPGESASPSKENEGTQEEEEKKDDSVRYIAIKYTGLNIRTGPSTSYSSLGTLEKDTFFAYLGTENGWYKTYYKGQTAYVSSSSEYTAIISMESSSSSAVEKVIEEGTKLIGTKYVYGATRLHDGSGNLLKNFTTTAFDCSSLTQYIFYYGANVLLQVTTRTQVVQGSYVEKANLKRGDCIYFTNSSRYHLTGIERVGHVALYLGDNYILHTASDYCKIEKMTTARWNNYIEARRFV